MIKVLKSAALIAQLVLAFHGEFHPLHENHAPETRKSATAIVR